MRTSRSHRVQAAVLTALTVGALSLGVPLASAASAVAPKSPAVVASALVAPTVASPAVASHAPSPEAFTCTASTSCEARPYASIRVGVPHAVTSMPLRRPTHAVVQTTAITNISKKDSAMRKPSALTAALRTRWSRDSGALDNAFQVLEFIMDLAGGLKAFSEMLRRFHKESSH